MVRAVTDGITGSKMPSKAESYVAFLDLCFVVGANGSDAKERGDDQAVPEIEKEIAVEGEGGEQGELEWGGGGGGGGAGETVDLGLRSGRKWHAFGIKGFDVSAESEDCDATNFNLISSRC